MLHALHAPWYKIFDKFQMLHVSVAFYFLDGFENDQTPTYQKEEKEDLDKVLLSKKESC